MIDRIFKEYAIDIACWLFMFGLVGFVVYMVAYAIDNGA